ncbi:HTH-type transcriptional activator CmpR [Clostridiales bacterium]|nr:HTH-type transcriptional activator CmpR [Clostridiales bacterium]
MNIKYLYTLKAILETGSFQKAALKLNYTQSTVTFHIQQLEEALSIKLFEKIGRKMVLTQTGKNIMPHVETILQEIELIHNCNSNDISKMSGILRVGMPDFLFCYKMLPLISQYRQQAPNIQLAVPSLHCKVIRDEIINGNLDIGIHCNIGGYPPSIIEEKWSLYYAVLVASRSVVNDTDFISKHQKKNINLIVSDSTSLHQKRLIKYLDEKDIVINSTIEMGSTEAAKISVLNNLGIAYLPDFTVEKEIREGTLIAIKTELDDIPIPVICAYHKNRQNNIAMNLFRTLIFKMGRHIV